MNELSLDDINSKSPYLVKRSDDGDYVFQTAKGVIYGIRKKASIHCWPFFIITYSIESMMFCASLHLLKINYI